MKILIVNSLYYPNIIGGAEISTQILAEGLNEFHDVFVLSSDVKERKDIVNGVRAIYIDHKNRYWLKNARYQNIIKRFLWHIQDILNLQVSTKIRRILQDLKPDIVITNNLSGFSVNIWRLVQKEKIPLIHIVRDHYLLCPRTTMFKENSCKKQCLSCRLFSMPKKNFSEKLDAVVGISRYILKRHLKNGFFSEAKEKK